MNEEEILQKLNKYMELINKGYCDDCNELNVICGESWNGSKNVKNAIESLIKIYKQEKEKNIDLKEKNRLIAENLSRSYISKDKIKEITDNYRFCKIERLKDFYKEIRQLLEDK